MTDESTRGQAKTPPSQPNPTLKALEGLVGEWEMELSNATFLPPSPGIVKGPPVYFSWAEEGAFLLMRMGDKSARPPQALWLFHCEETAPNYTVFYYDARSVSRIYEMSWHQQVWKMWRQAPGFWQRYEGQVSTNGKTITGRWEKSADGATWEHDFDVTYTRIS